MAKYYLPPDAIEGQTPRKAGGERLATRLEAMGWKQVPAPVKVRPSRAKKSSTYVNYQYYGN